MLLSQTGSGKTYSMGTSLERTNDPENEGPTDLCTCPSVFGGWSNGKENIIGIVPRCIDELFAKLQERADKDPEFKYEVYVSFLELYNEELIDLLNPCTAQKRKNNGSSVASTDIAIREDIAGNIYWSGVREERCENPEELLGYGYTASL